MHETGCIVYRNLLKYDDDDKVLFIRYITYYTLTSSTEADFHERRGQN